MSEKKIGYDDAYSLKTPEDSIKLYKKWAKTYDQDFALNSNYLSPKKISSFFNEHAKNTDTPILDVGAGTGLVGECLNKKGNKKTFLRKYVTDRDLPHTSGPLTGGFGNQNPRKYGFTKNLAYINMEENEKV